MPGLAGAAPRARGVWGDAAWIRGAIRERETRLGDTRSPLPELKKRRGKLGDHIKKSERLETECALY